MVGSIRLTGVRTAWTVLYLALIACSAARAEPAETASNNCPGHPDAIGTSRTLVVDPRAHPRIGSMQYPETLPLRDHEVVLTFDDGPIPRNSYQVLQILADNCVKATFFEVGEQARANPEGIRKLVAAGHTVGTHSQHHPLTFHRMSEAQAKQEVEDGIASARAAMTDPSALAPFFRIPGLLRAPPVEAYLETQGIQTWSTDFLADDWHRIGPAKVYELAMNRLHAMGKGILLLHDIQPRTVAALPKILHDMKAQGYRIVHVVPATADMPPTPTEPEEWHMHPTSEDKPIARWPKLPNFIYAETETLPAPAANDFDLGEASLSLALASTARQHGHQTAWPQLSALQVANAEAALPVPAADIFNIPEKARAPIQPFPVTMHHYAEGELPHVAEATGARGRHRHAPRFASRHQKASRIAHAAPAAARHHQPARPASGAKRTHVASLKKRRT
jgi:peptidoglycan/xylan/chitin deacetylase (PgdA/CDA1 family)